MQSECIRSLNSLLSQTHKVSLNFRILKLNSTIQSGTKGCVDQLQ